MPRTMLSVPPEPTSRSSTLAMRMCPTDGAMPAKRGST